MTRFYSDHFHATGVVSTLAGTLPLDNQVKIDQGRGGSPKLTKRAHINIGTGAQIGDEIRIMGIDSGWRLYEIFVTSDGGASAGAADLGIYKAGANHDGAAVDADLFGTAIDLSAAITRVDEILEATTLAQKDRGKYAWEQAVVGGASYTKNPVEQWELVFTVTTAFTVAVTDIIVELLYQTPN